MANIIEINQEMDFSSKANSIICSPEQCGLHLAKHDKSINILHLNIRSVNKNFDNLTVLLSMIKVKCSIIILTECWLSKVDKIPILDGYMSYHTKRTSNQNDGIIIYSDANLSCKISEPDFADANCLTCCVDQKLAIVAVYRSPSYRNREHFENFLNSLNNIYEKLSDYHNTALIGDINIDIKPDAIDERSNNYLILNAIHGLIPAHTLPTRLNNCLDHIMLKSKLTATSLVLEANITDHAPILLSIENVNPKQNSNNTVTRLDHQAIKSELENSNLTEILKIEDANDATEKFILLVTSVIAKHTHIVKIARKKRNIKPWITQGLLRCIANRNKLHKKSAKAPDNMILRLTYTRYRNFCNGLLRKLKRDYEKKEIEKAGRNPKALWNVIKEITNTKKQPKPATELLNICDNPNQAANQVCSFFTNIGKDLANKIISAKLNKHSESLQSNINSSLNSLLLLDTDANEVESIILQLRSDCATGWDKISTTVIKQCRKSLILPITHICNRSIQTGVFPQAFKKAIIHPIHKGGDRDCVSNYRPISVLTSLSKFFEKILNSRLNQYLDKHSIIASNQYGFRNRISTEDAVLDLTQFVAKQLDSKNKCLGIFLDMAKAFDTVSIPILLTKLENIGVRGIALLIFKDYLTNRTQQVKIDAYLSDTEEITFGVPQGSVLGPTLFKIYINDLCKLTIPNATIYTYADDTAIVVHGPNWEFVKNQSEHCLRLVINWLNQNLLTLNLNKTTYVTFSIRNSSKPTENFNITAHSCLDKTLSCDCHTITSAHTVRYLGVEIDERLRWDKQLNKVIARLRTMIYLFKSLRESATLELLIKVYTALCQSVIQYCITVWGGATKTMFLALERAQRAVLKVMSRKPFRYPTKQLYSDCQVLTVRQLFVLESILRRHRSVPAPDKSRRRTKIACPCVSHNTTFAKRQYYIISSLIYNKINNKLNIIQMNKHDTKNIVKKWLIQLDYLETEKLISST